jgi:hypothetical protein
MSEDDVVVGEDVSRKTESGVDEQGSSRQILSRRSPFDRLRAIG